MIKDYDDKTEMKTWKVKISTQTEEEVEKGETEERSHTIIIDNFLQWLKEGFLKKFF